MSDTPYTIEYFAVQDYARAMLESREIHGRQAEPLATTVMNMVDTVRPTPAQPSDRLYDVGCAFGYVVQAAMDRGWSARGMDLSKEVIENGPVPAQLRVGDATRDAIEDCDVAVCLNVFEHLTPDEALRLGRNLAEHAGSVVTVVNKSSHDPTHVTLESNRWWIGHLKSSGLTFDRRSTFACRAAYLRSGNWGERWWTDCIVFRGARPARGATLRSAFGFIPALIASATRIALRKYGPARRSTAIPPGSNE